MNDIAPAGQIFVCCACGKRSRDKHGNQATNKRWDVSCTLNSVLCFEDKLELKDGLVIKILDGGLVEAT